MIQTEPKVSSQSASTHITKGKWMVLLAAFLGWMFDGLEMGIFPLVARPALQDILKTTDDTIVGPWVGNMHAAFLLGAAAGGLLFGWLGDKIGRVRAMSLSILAYSLFTGLIFLATKAWHVALFRFLAALGMGGEWSLGVALVMEIWPDRLRPLMAGIIGAASNVGFAFIALLTIFWKVDSQSWRWVMLVGAVPALLTFFIRLFVPESERWKESVKKSDSKPLREVFSSKQWKLTLLGVAFASIALIGTWGSVQSIPTWVDKLTKDPVTMVSNPKAKSIAQFSASVGAIVGCIVGALLGGKFGRRPVYFALCLLSLGSCTFLFRGLNEFNAVFIMTVGVVGCVTAAFYGWLPLYLPELFPTRNRATGQGISFNSGRILAAAGASLMGYLVANNGGDYAAACGTITLVYIVGLVLIWLAPETKGKPLPD